MELEERAVDIYFMHIERDILALRIDIVVVDDQIDIEHAFTPVSYTHLTLPTKRIV